VKFDTLRHARFSDDRHWIALARQGDHHAFSELVPWLRGIAENLLRNHLRKFKESPI
jgi:hypothetical protein